MHAFILQTEQIVKHNRVERCTKVEQFLRWAVEMAPFVSRANDENAHVLAAGRVQGRGIVLTDVIPMQIEVVESTGVARIHNQLGGSMG